MGVDLRLGDRADGVSGRVHGVVDVGADEIGDVGPVEGGTDICVGNGVLHSAQVDMRQRRLRHGGDDAGQAGQLVGQHLVDHHVAGVGTLARVQRPQQAVPFLFVQRLELGSGGKVFVEYEGDVGVPKQLQFRQFRLGGWKRNVAYVQSQVVRKQRHRRREQAIGNGRNGGAVLQVKGVK